MDKPGREIPKEYREIVTHLIDTQGWRYDASRSGHPKLFPADPSQRMIPVPTTPGDRRSFANWASLIKRAGGLLP
jgi:hypothetical protein